MVQTRRLSWLDIAEKHFHSGYLGSTWQVISSDDNKITTDMVQIINPCDEHLMYLALFSYFSMFD